MAASHTSDEPGTDESREDSGEKGDGKDVVQLNPTQVKSRAHLFTKGGKHPNQSIGRPKGSLNKSTRLALKRLEESAPKAVSTLISLMEKEDDDAQKCPFCGRGMPRAEDLRLRASTSVLDRVGIGPSAKHQLTGENGGPIKIAAIRHIVVEPDGEEYDAE